MEKKLVTDLDKYDEDTTDIELQNRGMLERKDGGVRMILYTMLDRDYYDGDCPVLYVDLDKRSSKKWLGRK